MLDFLMGYESYLDEYRSQAGCAFALVFPRSQPMRESNSATDVWRGGNQRCVRECISITFWIENQMAE
jgi:hypothetical protein